MSPKRMVDTKMVPVPSHSIVPERDVDKTPVLETRHLGIEFGGLKAVEDFNLTIGKTEIAGLIGPNGAGKTTVFNLLTKVYQPTTRHRAHQRQGHRGHEHHTGQPPGHCPDVPEYPPVWQHDRGGQCAHWPAQPGALRHVHGHFPPAGLLEAGARPARAGPASCCPSSACRTWRM